MSVVLFLAVAFAGGLGAATRFVVDGALRAARAWSLPWATFIINVSGSALLGAVTALAVATILPEQWRLIVGTGFLGGYTTFSTASVETVRLAQQGRWGAALGNGLGMLLAGVAAAAAGYGVVTVLAG